MAKASETLAINMKLYREKRRLSQELLAEKVGVSGTTIWKLENGASWISKDTLSKIAAVLQIEETDLFLPPLSIGNVKDLTPEQLEILKKEMIASVEKTLAGWDSAGFASKLADASKNKK